MLEAVRLEPTEALRECKAGGHCLYAVLAYCLFGDMNRYPVLRQLVADAFRNDDLVMRVVHPVVPLEDADEIRTHLCKRREGGAVEDFLFNVRSGNAYAEIEEAATIGSLFNLTVTIISPDSDPVVLEPVCSNGSEAAMFRALLPSIQDGRISLTAPPQPPTAVKVQGSYQRPWPGLVAEPGTSGQAGSRAALQRDGEQAGRRQSTCTHGPLRALPDVSCFDRYQLTWSGSGAGIALRSIRELALHGRSLYIAVKRAEPGSQRELEQWFFKTTGTAELSLAALTAISDQFKAARSTKGQPAKSTDSEVRTSAKLEWRTLLNQYRLDGDIRLKCCGGMFAWDSLGHHLRSTKHQERAGRETPASIVNAADVAAGVATAQKYTAK